jgi:hypothetical protein
MVMWLGVVAIGVVVAAVIVVLVLAGRQAREDAGPESRPSDFVAPVSSGGYAWRRTDETVEEFQSRVARANTSKDG